MERVVLGLLTLKHGCYNFLDFSQISEFFTSTPLKLFFESSSLELVSQGFIIDSAFQKKVLYYFRLFH